MRSKHFENFGWFDGFIPQDLYDDLLLESKTALTDNPEMISGLTGKGVAKHRYIIKTKEKLNTYVMSILNEYNKMYNILDVKVLTGDVPLVMNQVWMNFQKQGECVPNHTHDGIFSWNIWLKIPNNCKIEFIYTNVIGEIKLHTLELTKEDEGRIIAFPAKMPHIAYPFYDSDDTRISISGNIAFNTGNLLDVYDQ